MCIRDRFLEYVAQGRLSVDDLVTHRHSPLEAADVYARLARDRADAIGVVLDWSRL